MVWSVERIYPGRGRLCCCLADIAVDVSQKDIYQNLNTKAQSKTVIVQN